MAKARLAEDRIFADGRVEHSGRPWPPYFGVEGQRPQPAFAILLVGLLEARSAW
jgi:hypothetical protein